MGKRRRRSPPSSTSSSSSSSTYASSSCSSTVQHSGVQILFGVILAALSNREIRATSEGNLVIQKALDRLLLSLLSKSPSLALHPQQTLHIPLISLLPVLLNSMCSEVACASLEIVGAASLFSIETNEQIASDEEIVKGLIAAVASCRRSVAIAACNALLDLLTTSFGRCKLLECSAIDKLIFCFLQVPKSSTPSISLIMEEVYNKTCFKIGFMEDEYPILLLDIAITLINDCTLVQLANIPNKLSKNFIKYLANIWAEVCVRILKDSVQESKKSLYSSNIRTNNLAESLFRLSMDDTFTTSSKFLEVKNGIFHSINFESFIKNHWEESPLLITKPSNPSFQDSLFNSFRQFLTSKQTAPSFLTSLLQNLVSTPPISSDELDIINFLEESREQIGSPIIYQQDIRVLKTLHSKIEKHISQESLTFQDTSSISNAYNNGYTFALRGMEFHFQDLFRISEGLAFLFGQPSTGVNMYLTPPNSQGLARHYDDHCVLVCQIQGVKRWKVFPNTGTRLPRLYEPLDDCINGGNDMMDGCEEFLLKEGDILYIPRGFPHEAYTVVDDNKANEVVEYSLHLTLAIEIEPPFEWEGFFHVALHHWSHNYKLSNHRDLADVAVHLMHVAIKLIGDVDPTFRKACLIGAISYEGWLQTHQQSIFNHLLTIIHANSNFKDVAFNVIKKHEDIFEKLRWLCHLDHKMPSMEMEDIFYLLIHENEKVEVAFMEVKSEFCNGMVFDDIVCCYSELLEKYRKTRKQYINGMLALNCI